MKNTQIDIRKLKECISLKGSGKACIFGSSAVKYCVYPLTLLCLLFGVIFTLEDTVKALSRSDTPPKQSESTVLQSAPVQDTLENAPVAPEDDCPYVIGIDDLEPLALKEYYYLNRDVLPDDIYGFNYNLVPQGHTGIIPISLARESNGGDMYIKNKTDYDLCADDLPPLDLPDIANTGEISVLIVHTHGTEAYTPDGVLSDDPNDPYSTRSKNNGENVVSLGKIMADVFEQYGIKTLHYDVALDTTIDDYSKAYSASAKIIKDTLKEYPSIQYVFDVHRDAVTLSTGEKAKALCQVDGKRAAQVMTVVGSDFLGQDHPNWKSNLALAIALQARLEDGYTDLCRPITVKQGAFNQHLSPFGLLLEIGTDGNTLQEAQYSAQLLAHELAQIIAEN